jgi:hypothetical protein
LSDLEGIQIMHEMTIEGYRITVFKKSGEFVMTWLMDVGEALEMAFTINKTICDHTKGVIDIIEKGANGGN